MWSPTCNNSNQKKSFVKVMTRSFLLYDDFWPAEEVKQYFQQIWALTNTNYL